MSLGAVIRKHRDDIIRAWEVAVRESTGANDVPAPLLRDEMPEVVEKIADLVGEPTLRPAPIAEPGEKHALQRLGIGFELAHLLMEYSVLRNCILEATAGELHLGVDDLIVLNRAIDTVANRSVERFSEASTRLLKSLDRITTEAIQSRSLDELLHRLLGVLMATSPAVDSVAILLKQDGVLRVRAAVGIIAERDPSFTITIGEGFSGTIGATREPRLSRSAANDPIVKSEFIKMRGIQALYGVPLAETELIGVAHMGSLTVHDFTAEEKVLFRAMATRATAAITHTQLLERLDTEHKLLVSVVRQMPIGVIIRSISSELIVANHAAEQMMRGAIPMGLPASGTELAVIDHQGNQFSVEEWPLSRALRGDQLDGEEIVVRWPDGALRTFQVWAAPVRDREDRNVAAVLVFEDISERKQAEREREVYISSMSHDLRTPLAAIQMTAELLLQRAPSKGLDAKSLQRIATNSTRMQGLIGQLLDFARSHHAGGIPITRRSVDLVALSRQVIDSLPPEQIGRVRLQTQGEVVGDWDPDRLMQILQNLIVNGIEHGRSGEPIDVAVSGSSREAVLQTSNQSVRPIPADLLPRIFDPFRRGVEGRGLGLGLYISQQIARAHGGEIRVHSDEKRTTFTLRLPRNASGR